MTEIPVFTKYPSRLSPTTFADDGDTFLSELPNFIAALNALGDEIEAIGTQATADAATAAGAALTAAAAANFKGEWDDLTGAANVPYSCYHDSKYWMLLSDLADVTAKEPGVDAEWAEIVMSGIENVVEDTTPQLGGDLDLNGHQITNHRADHWTKVTAFTATPASTSTLTMTSDLTASILVGMSLKYAIGGTTYYGRVSAIAAGLLTVNGAPLGGDVTALYYGGGTIRQVVVIIPGTYEDASNTALIASDLKSQLVWTLPKSYLVKFSVYSNTHDTGTHGQASVRINNTEVCTTAGGLTIAADATWYHTVVDIDSAAYDVNPGEAVEITSVKAGNGDASDLTVIMVFVTP